MEWLNHSQHFAQVHSRVTENAQEGPCYTPAQVGQGGKEAASGLEQACGQDFHFLVNPGALVQNQHFQAQNAGTNSQVEPQATHPPW